MLSTKTKLHYTVQQCSKLIFFPVLLVPPPTISLCLTVKLENGK